MRLPSISRAIIAPAALLLAGAVHADLVVNGGFETSDFTGWTQTGDTGFSGVVCSASPSTSIQSGNCSALFGPVGALGGISQTLATLAGATYDISFWLLPDGGDPSQFIFNWDGGAAELSLSSMPGSPAFIHYQFELAASSANTSLSFSFRDDSGFLVLDSVTVNPAATAVPEPGSLALISLALLAATGSTRAGRRLPKH